MAKAFNDNRVPLDYHQVKAILDRVPALKAAWDEAKESGSTERKIKVTCPNEECGQRPSDKTQCTVTLDEDFIWCHKCSFGGRLDVAAAKMLGIKTIALIESLDAETHLTSNEHYSVLGFKDDSNCKVMAVVKRDTGTVELVRVSGDKAKLRDVASEETFSRIFYPNRPDAEHDEATFTGAMGRRIVNALERRCKQLRRRGVEYGEEDLKGRGVALIGGEPVYNLGAHVLRADGSITFFDTEHIGHLQSGKMISELPSRELADAYEPERFRRLFGLIRDNYPLSDCGAEFLLGWVANSLISGLHKVNPNLSFTGASSGGKSWLMDEVFRAMLGRDFSGVISKNSTKAGIRRLIGNSSIGVFFDEAEASKSDWGNVSWVVDLMRQMATGSAVIQLGDKNNLHGYVEFRPSAPVMIVSNLEADLSRMPDMRRILRVELREGAVDNFDETLGRDILESIGGDFAAEWRSRMLYGLGAVRSLSEMLRSHLSKHGYSAGVIDMVAPTVSALAHSMAWGEEETTYCALRCAGSFKGGLAEVGVKDWEMVLNEILGLNLAEGRLDAGSATVGEILCELDTGRHITGVTIDNPDGRRIQIDRMGLSLSKQGELRVRYMDGNLKRMVRRGGVKSLLQNSRIGKTRHSDKVAALVPVDVWQKCLSDYLKERFYGSPPEGAPPSENPDGSPVNDPDYDAQRDRGRIDALHEAKASERVSEDSMGYWKDADVPL